MAVDDAQEVVGFMRDLMEKIEHEVAVEEAEVGGNSERSMLEQLSAELQQLIVACLHDEADVLRAGATCTALREAARCPALWRRFLMRFFGGELPPALVDCDDPRQTLRAQLSCAQELTALEHDRRKFQAPNIEFPGAREWMDALDARVAEKQGRSAAYYGCSGGAYVQSTTCYDTATASSSRAC